jgi:hypothetical protein
MFSDPGLHWPPKNGLAFVQSEAFGLELLAVCGELRRSNPELDFSDSVAEIFEWLDKKIGQDPHFLSRAAFPSHAAFLAYIRVALLRVALLRKRQSRRMGQVLADDSSLLDPGPSPEAIAIRDEMIDRLGSPCADLIRKLLGSTSGEIDQYTGDLNLTRRELEKRFERCLDHLWTASGAPRAKSRKRRR